MNLFQPSDAKSTTTGGPSPAVIALLEAILNSAGKPQPTFKDFVGGARPTNSLPPGLGTMLAGLGPNSFQRSSSTTTTPSAPGMVSDIGSLLALLSLIGGGGTGGAAGAGGGGGGGALGGAKALLGGGKDLLSWLFPGGGGGAALGGTPQMTNTFDPNAASDPLSLATILGGSGGDASF